MSVLSVNVLAAAGGKAPTAGWALLIFLALALGCFVLFRSMSHHLRKARQMPPDRSDDNRR